METSGRLTDKEYEELSLEYEQNPPKLSGKAGFMTKMSEKKKTKNPSPKKVMGIASKRAHTFLLKHEIIFAFRNFFLSGWPHGFHPSAA